MDGVYTEIMRRLHGETEYTNVEIKKTGKITIFFFFNKKTRLTPPYACDYPGHRVIQRQPEYGLFDSNCQRFVTILAWEVLKTPSYELDLIAGRATFEEAEGHVSKGEVKSKS